jgi:hypothetical protein
MLTDYVSSAHVDVPDDGGCLTTSRLDTFLFGLSLALALPPKAMVAPPDVFLPTILPSVAPIVTAGEVAGVLGHAAYEVGRGQVAASEIDARLDGLRISLDVLRLSGNAEALIAASVVAPDPAQPRRGLCTPHDLWALVRSTPAERGDQRFELGVDTQLTLHADRTAQLVWLALDYLAAVSVTHLLAEDTAWLITATRSVANLVASRFGVPRALTR